MRVMALTVTGPVAYCGGAARALVEHAHFAEHFALAQCRQTDFAIVSHFRDFDVARHDFIGHVAGIVFAEDDVAVVERLFGFFQRDPQGYLCRLANGTACGHAACVTGRGQRLRRHAGRRIMVFRG